MKLRVAEPAPRGSPSHDAAKRSKSLTNANRSGAKRSDTTTVLRCAIYTRKSTSTGLEQAFNSLDAQWDACADYVRRQAGWTIIEERYDDGGYTGANTDRPAFKRLLADVDAGKIDVILVYKVDRLSRSLLDFAQMMSRFADAGVSFVSVTQNFSTADAIGRLTLNMLMSFAEFERDMIAERTRDKIAGARRRGKWTGGIVPLGYSVVDGKLVVNEVEAVVVREIFDIYLAHRTSLAVVRLLNERHRDTKRHRATNGRIREGHAWTTGNVYRVLHNPLYAGYSVSGGERFDGEHQALISRDAFRLVEATFADRTTAKRGRPENPRYLLRGVLRCGCGATFTPASTTTNEVVYRYYRCGTRGKRGASACRAKPLPADAIEQIVVAHLRQVFANSGQELAAEVTAAVRVRVATRGEAIRVERATLPAQIAALNDELRGVVEPMSTAGGPAHRVLQERLTKLSEQLERREAQLAAAERESAQLAQLEVEAAWIERCLIEFDEIWETLPASGKVRLVRAVIARLDVDERSSNVAITLIDFHEQLPCTEGTPEINDLEQSGTSP